MKTKNPIGWLIIVFLVFVYERIAAQRIEDIITLPNSAAPRDLLYNSIDNKIYSANTPDLNNPGPATESVSVINGATNQLITSIPMKKGSRDFCHNTINNKIYVANYFADSVTVIDGKTDMILDIIPVGDGPRALVYNTKNNRIYCINELSSNVTVIDGNTNAVITTIVVGSKPRVACYNPLNNKIYVPNAGSGNLSVISGETNTVIATTAMGNVPRGIVYNPQNNKVYVSNYSSDNVMVVDGVTNDVLATITVGDGPTAIFHNPEGNKIYCSNVGAPGPNTPKECTVSIIDAGTSKVIKTLITGDEPTAFCYANRSRRIYWANEWSHDIAVVDAIMDTFITVVKFANPPVTPVDVCYNPVHDRIYTANRLKFSIAVLKDSVKAQSTVRAWNADGQVFVVWKTKTPAPLMYNIYISPNQVASVSDAVKVGSLFEPEWKGKRLTLAKPDASWTIPDGNGGTYRLAPDEGLFVYTPHDTSTVYFYVNQHNETQLSATNRTPQPLFVRYNPDTEAVKCHAQFTGVTEQGFPYTVFAMWVDGRDDPNDGRPDIPVMANGEKNGAPHVFAVFHPQNGLPAGPFPAVVCLHGGGQQGSYWTYAPNSGHYRNTGNVPVDGVTIAFDDRIFLAANGTVNEDRPSNWFGWHTSLNPINALNPSANSVVVPYTLKRLLWTIDWLIQSSSYKIDARRIAVMGNSMGGTGTLLLTRWKPERFSAATAFVPPHYTPETGVRLFGNTLTNLKTNEMGPDGVLLKVNDFFNPAIRISAISRDFCLTRIYRGRCDEAAEWGSQHIQLYNSLNNAGLGTHLYWDNRDHTASDWTTNDAQTPCPDIGQWVSPIRTLKGGVAYQSRFKSDQSYPGFFNDDQNLALTGRQPSLGNGDVNDGDVWGTWAGYYEWDVNTISDSSTHWASTIYLTGQSQASIDNYPGDSSRCDMTVLKPKYFKPVPGTLLQWRLIRLSDNTILQNGKIEVDQSGKVTVPEITIYKNPKRTRLIIEYADTDLDGDGFAAMSDCNDSDASVYPGAIELCDEKDNDCNGEIDDDIVFYTYYRDMDGDGYGNAGQRLDTCIAQAPATFVPNDLDCDDNNVELNPGATEICDGTDNNCNDRIDEELLLFTYFRDADGDGYGNPGQRLDTCIAEAPAAFVPNDLDCDDSNAAINPAQTELPGDNLDNDCDGKTDNTSATKDSGNLIRVYPNPVYDWLIIDSPLKQEIWYEISDLKGKVVRKGNAKNIGGIFRISFLSEPAGAYMLSFREEHDKIAQKIKVIKM